MKINTPTSTYSKLPYGNSLHYTLTYLSSIYWCACELNFLVTYLVFSFFTRKNVNSKINFCLKRFSVYIFIVNMKCYLLHFFPSLVKIRRNLSTRRLWKTLFQLNTITANMYCINVLSAFLSGYHMNLTNCKPWPHIMFRDSFTRPHTNGDTPISYQYISYSLYTNSISMARPIYNFLYAFLVSN